MLTLQQAISGKSLAYMAVLKQLSAIGQLEIPEEWREEELNCFLEKMVHVDAFYQEMGGIVGYQKKIQELLHAESKGEEGRYHPPSFIQISEETPAVWESIWSGLQALPQMAQMVPLGGAADRLHLIDEKTGGELPAAKLTFAGRPLLATIIRDLQAWEYLYYKLYGKQCITPLALMTSEEKENHFHVQQLFEENLWFGRPKESIRFFLQPLVPVVTEEGNWCWIAPFKPLMKPGGHGAIWKLARDQGIFRWFQEQKRTKTLVRQINNPIAGLDYGFLSFCGMGVQRKMLFGFASCPRLAFAAEGVNVLLEKNGTLVLTNVEYCDFAKTKIEEERFSSNTNILFADLAAIERAVQECPYPGLLINLKKTTYTTHLGEKKEALLARLESTMQNIADVFTEKRTKTLTTQRTFITYNHRHKTISTAKRAYFPGGSLQETPEKCFYDLLFAHRELLLQCGWALPSQRTLEQYLSLGPDFLFLYHPALGPLFQIIRQKIRGGKGALGSELQLEIADFDSENLRLEGSLLITAEQVMGHAEPYLIFSEKTGRCVLKNVSVCNRGVDWSRSAPFWKNRFERKEALEIVLKGHSEFVAENVQFAGSHRFEVEEGIRLRVMQRQDALVLQKEKIEERPFWTYEKRRGGPAAKNGWIMSVEREQADH